MGEVEECDQVDGVVVQDRTDLAALTRADESMVGIGNPRAGNIALPMSATNGPFECLEFAIRQFVAPAASGVVQ